MTTATATLKDKVYKLKGASAPLSFILPSRSTKRYPLLYWDEEKQLNRELRYATNQKSPFVDEQDSNFLVAPIIFENGFLTVPRTNPALQLFLQYMPLNGLSYEEVDLSRDAEREVELMNLEDEAIIASRSLSLLQIENLVRVVLGKDPHTMTSSIMTRDVRRYARNNPKEFLRQINDPELAHQSLIRSFFDKKMLGFRANNSVVHYNLNDNKSRLMAIPPGTEDPYKAVGEFLLSDEGIDILKSLENVADLY